MLDARCPGCGMAIRVKEAQVDRRARCTRCDAVFRVRAALVPGQNVPAEQSSPSDVSRPRTPAKNAPPVKESAEWFDDIDLAAHQDEPLPQLARIPRTRRKAVDGSPEPPVANPPLLPPVKRSKSKSTSAGWSWRSRWAGGGGVLTVVILLLRVVVALSRNGSFSDRLEGGPQNTDVSVTKWFTSNTLQEARSSFHTKLTRQESAGVPVPVPPAGIFRVVQYDSKVGPLSAYLTPDPGDGRRRPAIVWIGGGDCNSIEEVWQRRTPDNDQTAAAFREAGIVMMFPSLRGGNDNPGWREGFYGEVEDVLSATDFLAAQPHVDPERIYLGGHSTGGTLALLVAESSERYRAVFCFGPARGPLAYGAATLPIDVKDLREVAIRTPYFWMHSVKRPVYVLEGEQRGNIGELRVLSDMAQKVKNPLMHFLPVRGADHFNILAPATKLIAQKILADQGGATSIAITKLELDLQPNVTRAAGQLAENPAAAADPANATKPIAPALVPPAAPAPRVAFPPMRGPMNSPRRPGRFGPARIGPQIPGPRQTAPPQRGPSAGGSGIRFETRPHFHRRDHRMPDGFRSRRPPLRCELTKPEVRVRRYNSKNTADPETVQQWHPAQSAAAIARRADEAKEPRVARQLKEHG